MKRHDDGYRVCPTCKFYFTPDGKRHNEVPVMLVFYTVETCEDGCEYRLSRSGQATKGTDR